MRTGAIPGLRVLIVEDETLLVMEYEHLLEAAGHQVVGVAATASAALALAAENRPDCAFVDMNLRDGATGADVAQSLVSEFGIPVLFVTSNRHLVPIDRPGVIGCLPKPFTADMFLGAVCFVAALVQPDRVWNDDCVPYGLLLSAEASARGRRYE